MYIVNSHLFYLEADHYLGVRMRGKRPSLLIRNEIEARKKVVAQKIMIVKEIETETEKETVKGTVKETVKETVTEIVKDLLVIETEIAIVAQRTVELEAVLVIIAEVDLEIEKVVDHDLCTKVVVHVTIDVAVLEIIVPEIV